SYKPIFPASRLSGLLATVAVPLLLRSSGASFDSPASLRRFPSLRFSAGQNRALPVVEINGIEPLTSCLQSRRSPSRAIPPTIWLFTQVFYLRLCLLESSLPLRLSRLGSRPFLSRLSQLPTSCQLPGGPCVKAQP